MGVAVVASRLKVVQCLAVADVEARGGSHNFM